MRRLLRALRSRAGIGQRAPLARLLSAAAGPAGIRVDIEVVNGRRDCQPADLVLQAGGNLQPPTRLALQAIGAIRGASTVFSTVLPLTLAEHHAVVDPRIARFTLVIELGDGPRLRVLASGSALHVEAHTAGRTLCLRRAADGLAELGVFRRRTMQPLARIGAGRPRRAIVFAGSLGYRSGKAKALLQIAASLARAGHAAQVLTVFADNDPVPFPLGEHVGLDHVAHPFAPSSEQVTLSDAASRREPAAVDGLTADYLGGTDAELVICTWQQAAALRAALPARVRLVVSDHDGRRVDLVAAGRCDPAYVQAVRLADAVHVVDPLIADAARSLTERPVIAIGNAVASGPVVAPDRLFAARRIVAAGRLVPVKRFDHLISAFALVADRLPGWTLSIYGDGPEQEPLQALIAACHLRERARLEGFNAALEEEFARGAVLASTSRVEAFGLSIAEAMAAGCPVVAYDRAIGSRALVRDGAGLLVPDGKRRRLAAAIEQCCREIESRDPAISSRVTVAQARVAAFAPEQIALAWDGLVARVCAR